MKSSRISRVVFAVVAVAAVPTSSLLRAQAPVVLLTAAAPSTGQAGVTGIAIVGSGFPAGTILPASTTVKLELAAGGGAVLTTPTAVTTITGSTRRVSFQIPNSIVVGSPAAYLVSVSGTTAASAPFASLNKAALTINPAATISTVSANTGDVGQNLTITITGQNTTFVQGASKASFGAGIAVGGAAAGTPGPITVTSATTATAQIVISPAADGGARNVIVTTGLQQAILSGGFNVTSGPPPTITDFNPKSAPIGTSVTLSGTSLVSPSGIAADLRLAKLGGGVVSAPITSASATSMSFVIPSTAATGTITAAAAGGSATSSATLTVVPSSTFTVTAAPSTLNLIAGQTATFTISLASTNGFTGLAQLSRTGVPAGVTATFNPTQITTGQQSTLTVTAPSSQTSSTSTVVITAAGTVDGLPVSVTGNATLNISPITTSFVGRTVVDDTNHASLAGITVKMLGKDGAGGNTGCTGQTVSDASGNFALTNLPLSCTGPQLVDFDGSTATSPPGKYAGVDLVFSLVANQVVASPVLVHLPRIDNVETFLVQQNSSVNQSHVFTSIPGLSVTVYANTIFTKADGTQPNPFPLAAVEVPVDRLPDAIPLTTASVNAFIVAFQPANTTASKAVAVYFPNTLNTPPGTNVPLTTLDPTRGRMVPYGTGTISNDGTTIIPDIDPSTGASQRRFGIIHFDWHGPAVQPPPDNNPSPDPCAPKTGKPVDLASGVEVLTSTDISLTGLRGSVIITRIYRTLSGIAGPFGIGTSHDYDYRLDTLAPQNAQIINLILPSATRIPFTRVASGELLNQTVPMMKGAVMTTASDGTTVLRWKNGSSYRFIPGTFGIGSVLTAVVDQNGNTITIVRAPSNPAQISEIDDPVGRKLVFAYDGANRITAITDPLGRSVTYTYNPAGTLSSFVNTLGGTTQYLYDAQNRLTKVTDPRGVVLAQNVFDVNGRVVQQTTSSGGSYFYAYTLTNPLVPTSPVVQTQVTDPAGNITTYRFNTQGFLVSASDPTGQTRTFDREAGTNLLLSVHGAGSCQVCGATTAGDMTFTYDANGNLATRTDALGNKWIFTSEPIFNNITSAKDPLGNTTTYVYDGRGNLTKTTDARGNSIIFVRDGNGLITSAKDGAGNITSFTYDSLGNLDTVSNALGQKTRFTYDAVSRLVAQLDPLGRTSTVTYNPADEPTALVDGNGHSVVFTYNNASFLSSYTDPRGGKTDITYDAAGRVSSRTDPLKRVKTYQYDLNDNLIGFTNRRGQSATYGYDSLNRLVSETYPDATVQHTYDSAGRLIRAVDSQSGTFNISYDLAGQVVRVVGPNGTIDYTRDAGGRVSSRQVQGQPLVTYTYDQNGNLTRAKMGTTDVTRSYDPRNLLTTNTRSNAVTGSYSFDLVGRILSMSEQSAGSTLFSRAFTYSAAGQITGNTLDRGLALSTPAATGTFDAANEVTSFGGTSYTSDADGNRLTETTAAGATTSYTWDARGRLQSVLAPGGVMTSFIYDPGGRMIQKRVTTSGSDSLQRYILDDASNIVSVEQAGTGTTSIVDGRGPDDIIAMVQGGSPVFPLLDQLGSEGALTDGSGAVIGREFYEPYGVATGSGTAGPFYYTGRPLINNTLYYNRARFYDSATGRFLSEDPIGPLGSGPNLYAYVRGNPINATDPSGEFWWILGGALIGGLGDLGYQLYENGGNFGCVDWWEVGKWALGGAGAGALASAYAVPATLYHFTSAEAAASIAGEGITAGGGLFGSGVYGSAYNIGWVARLMGAASTETSIAFSTEGLTVARTLIPGAFRVIGNVPVSSFILP